MSPGQIARKIIGDRWFPIFGRMYRRFFVDLDKVVDNLPALPANAHILDVGGGDGQLENFLLRRHPSFTVSLIDLPETVGTWLAPEIRDRVALYPRTSVADYASLSHLPLDAILLSDVVHHVPVSLRQEFFTDIKGLVGDNPVELIVKDMEPKGLKAKLAYLADRYITGDRVSLLTRYEMRDLVQAVFPQASYRETNLLAENGPNYCLVFSIKANER